MSSLALAIRRVPEFWRRALLGVGGLLLCEVGARIAMPNLNVAALGNFLRRGGGSFLLSLYDRVGGGGLSRGGVLALGIMPYLSARIMVRLLRVVSPAMEEMSRSREGQRKLTRGTRILTVGLALIQSYGVARFLQGIPGAVATPGAGFIAQTMAVLTTGSIIMMALSERISRSDDDGPVRPDHDEIAPVASLPTAQPAFADSTASRPTHVEADR